MRGGVSGALLHATTRAGGGRQNAVAEGCERSYRWIRSCWCMLGNEDEPSGRDAWASRSWRAGNRRVYAQKLAKIAEFDSLAVAELLFSLEGLWDLCCLVTGFSNL